MKNTLFNTYLIRLILRVIMLAFGGVLYFKAPELLVIDDFNFFSSFSITHVFWIFLLVILLFGYIPTVKVSIGALKHDAKYYKASKFKASELKEFKRDNDKKAIVVAVVWILFNTPFWILYLLKVITSKELLIIVLIFAVIDIFCILIFCPFQLFFRNRCCTTCRIFIWDHIMLVTPILVVPGFFARSLVIIAIISVIVWEMQWHRHTEYFWEGSNINLRCSSCNNRICKIKKPIIDNAQKKR